MASKPTSIDAYLESIPADRRPRLELLRRAIAKIVPEATECISYSMPAFRLDGHVVAGFMATKKGYSYYPFSGTTLSTLAPLLKGYEQTKSALHVPPDKALPVALLRKLIAARRAEWSTAPAAALAAGKVRTRL